MKINQIAGLGIPLIGDDIDTDRIMPARYLKELTFENLGRYVFVDEILSDPHHSFNLPKFREANFLVVNSNFGCGSSREHAPQGIKRWGIDCIIGVSFAEIFYANSVAIGLPCLEVSPKVASEIQELLKLEANAKIDLNLELNTLKIANKNIDFNISKSRRDAFFSGEWDVTSLLLSNKGMTLAKKKKLDY